MAPHHAYQQGDDPLQIRHQVRQLVSACHQAGLEVLVDVVYNHTCEGNQAGPTLSWRGIDDRNYYHQNAKGDYLDVSGCGNSIAANRPHSRRLILESMRCWALELGVDGFRFDLGIALSRGDELAPLDHPPLFEEIEADPELADLKLVSEPWDCGGLYRLADFPARRIGAWNGRFRDDVRRFWKGDEKSCWPMGQRLAGSPDLFGGQPALLGRSITFLTAHDGFTLADLVSYSQKHNLANGEDNRDGDNHNNNWNHGAEGPSTDAGVTALRNRQLRNLLCSLLLSPGVPMLLMGDEVRRSQGGNNNAWCQNNVLGWMHWQPDADDQALRLFVQRLIHLRHHLADLLNPEIPHPEAGKALRFDQAGHLMRQWDGVKLAQPDWAAWSHTLAWSLNDREHGPLIWCGMNAYHEDLSFEIPSCSSDWKRVIDTHQPTGEDLPSDAPSISGDSVAMGSRSLVLLVAAPLMEGHQL
jgi:glycogen operon protein